MENQSKQKWDAFYKSDACLDVADDNWLKNHIPLLKDNEWILDLCLHYFDLITLAGILSNLSRILICGGKLCARLNSLYDGMDGVKVSESYYYMIGIYRVFFTEACIRECWFSWDIHSLKEYDIYRYGETKKTLLELVCKNTKALGQHTND